MISQGRLGSLGRPGSCARLSWLAGLILCALPLTAQSQDRNNPKPPPKIAPKPEPEPDPAELPRLANAAFEKEDWARAVALYGKLLGLDPGNPIATKRKREADAKLAQEREAAAQSRREAEESRRQAAEAARQAKEHQAWLAKERKSLPLYRETAKGLIAEKDWTGATEYLKKIAAVDAEDSYLTSVLGQRRKEAEAQAAREDFFGAARTLEWVCGIKEDRGAAQQREVWTALARLQEVMKGENLKLLNAAIAQAARLAPAHALVEKAKGPEAEWVERRRKLMPPENPQPGARWKDPATTMDFCWVPAGRFMMGSTSANDEQPVHPVTFSRGFWMGQTEVTQAQWVAMMASNPSHFKGDDSRPVESVSWDDAKTFLARLTARGEAVYRLPSEAEWEYACRAETTGDFAGDLKAMAWYDKNSGSTTHPVGQMQANAWGLQDMHGNVWEWCEDLWHGDYSGAPTDGSVWMSGGDSTRRVLRGGSWYYGARYCRSAFRFGYDPTARADDLGFRVVVDAPSRTP